MPRKSRSKSRSRKSPSKRRSSKRSSSGSRKRKLSPAAKRWHSHLMKVYRDNKKKRASYSLRQAMKEAKKTYRK